MAVEAGYLPRNPVAIKGTGLERAAEMRHVSIPQLHALAEHLEEFAAPESDGLVFRSGRGTYLQRSNFSRLIWRPATHQLGLDGLRFHDLRHTAATLAAAAGATTRELMERMGYTSPAVALRYQHVMADRQATVAAALDLLTSEATRRTSNLWKMDSGRRSRTGVGSLAS